MYKVVDTETTKLHGEVIELASVEVASDGRAIGIPINHLVASDQFIEYGAMGVHGITPEMLVDAPLLDTIIDEHTVEDGGYIIGHNLSYDTGVLPDEYSEDVKQLCTWKLAKKLYSKDQVDNYKNMTLFYALGCYKDFEYEGSAHRADYDVMVTAKILEVMLRDNNLTVETAYELTISDAPEKPVDIGTTVCNFKKHKGTIWNEVVEEDYDYCYWLLNNFNWSSPDDPLKVWLTSKL